MEFTSLNKMYEKYIQSFPELTRLNLTANEIKIIELALSFTRIGKEFYMNHTEIADRIVIGNTVHRAKTVGNIIGDLKKKGYITTTVNPNYNGKNGGSSSTIQVNETLLEQRLNEVFNPVSPVIEIIPEIAPETESSIIDEAQQFVNELAEMDALEERFAPNERKPFDPANLGFEADNLGEPDAAQIDFNQMDEVEFDAHLRKLMRAKSMDGEKLALQMLIDNPKNWELQYRKGGLQSLIK